jgi:hypothetical protein
MSRILEENGVGAHPSAQAAWQLDDALSRPGLKLFSNYEASYADGVFVPGSLQTEEYSHAVSVHFNQNQQPDVAAIVREARPKRLNLALQQRARVEFFMPESVSRNPCFEDDVLAGALWRMVDIIDQKRPGLSIRIVENEALESDDKRLLGLRGFIITEGVDTRNNLLRVVRLDDGLSTASLHSVEYESAPKWREALGELALSQEDSYEFLESEAGRLNAGRP